MVQGDRLALEFDDMQPWVARFSRFPRVQVIDLDAAKGAGSNEEIVRTLCGLLSCRVGGGVRSADDAKRLVDAGAAEVIVGSALFRDGAPDVAAASRLAEAIGVERLVGALDSRNGRIAVRGWQQSIEVSAVAAAPVLEPFCGGFLYTLIDTEGLMGGIDIEAVRAVRNATRRRVAAAGGITTQAEIDLLAGMDVDAVVGMAIYTGALHLDA